MKNNLVLAGIASSTHGIKGLIKINSNLEYPENFANYNFYGKDGKKIEVEYKFKKKNFAVCSVNNISNIEDAERFIGTQIFIKREELPETEDGEFYYSDLEGLKVIDVNSKEYIGHVVAVYNYGAGDIIEITDKNKAGGKTEMFSFKDEIFPNINIKEGIIEANLPEIEFNQEK